LPTWRVCWATSIGLSGTVDTLERAVNVVGLSLVRSRAMALCMARVCTFPVGMDRMMFWHHSLRCAQYAQWLANLCAVDDQEAWLCGMMLRLGEITMAAVRPGCLLRIEAQPITVAERWTRQRQVIGFTEGEITAELARYWDFPAPLHIPVKKASCSDSNRPVIPIQKSHPFRPRPCRSFRFKKATLHLAER